MLLKIKENYSRILLVAGVVVALFIRYLCLDFESFDYMGFISKWVQYFRDNGGFYGLKNQIGDYNVVYQYIMAICSYFEISSLYTSKFFSIVADFMLAFGCCRVLSHFGVKKELRHLLFITILLLPTVWLNSAFWGQCDSIYVGFIVWSLYFLLEGKNYRSVIFLALAFTFKLQTVFFMPVFFLLLVKRQIKFRHLLMFPITCYVTCIPALLFGKPFGDIVGIYFNQMSEYPWLSMNAPTFWQMINVVTPDATLEKVGILLAGVVVVVLLALCFLKKDRVSDKTLLSLALLLGVGIPFFLPHMHDRYFYLADILSVVCVFVFGLRRIGIALCIQYASLTCYLHYFGVVNLYGGKILPIIMTSQISGGLMLLSLVLLLLSFICDFRSAGKLPAKKLSGFAFAGVLLVFILTQIVSPNPISVKVNGKHVCFVGVTPYEQGETVMVPIKGFLNSAGYFISVSHETGRVTASKGERFVEFVFAEDGVIINGERKELIYPHVNVNSNNYLSSKDLSMICEMTEHYENGSLVFEAIG